MRFLSLFSGIEAASAAWCPLGWEAVAFAQNQGGEVREGDAANTLNQNGNATGRNAPLARCGMMVRRLTPRECERLQGFPDDYTAIPYRGKPACDGPRYRALGNSMAVPVMSWIGKRIALVEDVLCRLASGAGQGRE